MILLALITLIALGALVWFVIRKFMSMLFEDDESADIAPSGCCGQHCDYPTCRWSECAKASQFDEVTVCPHCGSLTEEKFIGDEGATFCTDGCGNLEGYGLIHKFQCKKCYEIVDEEKCNCK